MCFVISIPISGAEMLLNNRKLRTRSNTFPKMALPPFTLLSRFVQISSHCSITIIHFPGPCFHYVIILLQSHAIWAITQKKFCFFLLLCYIQSHTSHCCRPWVHRVITIFPSFAKIGYLSSKASVTPSHNQFAMRNQAFSDSLRGAKVARSLSFYTSFIKWKKLLDIISSTNIELKS